MNEIKVNGIIAGFKWKMVGLSAFLFAFMAVSLRFDVPVLHIILLGAALVPMAVFACMRRTETALKYNATVKYDESIIRWRILLKRNSIKTESMTKFFCEMKSIEEPRSFGGGISVLELCFRYKWLFCIPRTKRINDILNVSQLALKKGEYKGKKPLAELYCFLEEKYPEKAGGMINMR